MALKDSQLFTNLKKLLQKELKNYKEIEDIIIFGSFMRGKYDPEDIDILLVLNKMEITLTSKIKRTVQELHKNIHIESILLFDYVSQPILMTTLAEGYSVSKDKLLSAILNLKSMTLFTYRGNKLSSKDKVALSRAMHTLTKETGAEKKGKGNILVPRNKAGQIEDFFELWKGKLTYSKINLIKIPN